MKTNSTVARNWMSAAVARAKNEVAEDILMFLDVCDVFV